MAISIYICPKWKMISLFSTLFWVLIVPDFWWYLFWLVWGHNSLNLISFSLTMNNVEHIFLWVLAICISSLEKCLFRTFALFFIWMLFLLILSYMSCLNILEIKPLSAVLFAIIFSHSERCIFISFTVSFAVQKLLTLIQFSSLTQLCPTLFEPMDHSMPGLPAHHQLPQFS